MFDITLEALLHLVLENFYAKLGYDTYHNWRDEKDYEDIQGFCKSANIDEVKGHEYILTPGRYVGIEDALDQFESMSKENSVYEHSVQQVETIRLSFN